MAHVIKVLGSGCKKCRVTAERIEKLAGEAGVTDVEIVKEEDLSRIMGYGIMSTPGVVIDEQVVHSGSVPGRKQIKAWLEGLGG